MDCDVSIRITFPKEITTVLRKEKERFVAQYGSGYKSEPHITLYLDRYTADGYPKLLRDLRSGLRMEPFTVTLLPPAVRHEAHRHRNLYIMDVSNKELIVALAEKVDAIAIPYRSPFMSEKKRLRLERQGYVTDGTRESLKAYPDLAAQEAFDPHITLGEIDLDAPQADLAEVRAHVRAVEGREISVSGITVFFYGKKESEEKSKLIEEVEVLFG